MVYVNDWLLLIVGLSIFGLVFYINSLYEEIEGLKAQLNKRRIKS